MVEQTAIRSDKATVRKLKQVAKNNHKSMAALIREIANGGPLPSVESLGEVLIRVDRKLSELDRYLSYAETNISRLIDFQDIILGVLDKSPETKHLLNEAVNKYWHFENMPADEFKVDS